MKRRVKAFTLIELLVVIAIVGILSGFVFVSMNSAINASKDAKRKADIGSIQKALMMYSAAGGSYPVLASCTVGATGCVGDPANNVLSNYLGTMPTDPDSTKHYTYSSNGTDFTLQATLNSGAAYSYSTASGWTSGIAGYAHYKVITVTNSSGGTLTNYPIKLTVYQASGQGSGSNCEGLCQTNFSDLAFADVNGNTSLPFWLETGSLVSNTSVTVWVNVPTIATGSTTQIRMYYNSSSPSLVSNGDSTFPISQGMFFDDFNGSSIDSSKWVVTNSPTLSSGIATLTGSGTHLTSVNTFGVNYVFKSRLAWTFGASLRYWQGFCSTDMATYAAYNSVDTQYAVYGSPAGGYGLGAAYTGYHNWEIIRNSSTSIIPIIDSVAQTQILPTNVPTTNLPVKLGSTNNNNGTTTVDWVLVRTYAATEPTAAFGSQN